MIEYLLSPEGLKDLRTLFLWAVALALFIGWFFSYCRRTDELWKIDNPLDTDRCPNTVDVIRDIKPKLYAVDPTNIDQVLALHGVSAQDRADIIKGSKLS